MLNKLIKATKENWIQALLWTLTFLFLIVFVILSVAIDKTDKSLYANSLAGVGAVFGLLLVGSLFTTAIMSYIKGKRGVK